MVVMMLWATAWWGLALALLVLQVVWWLEDIGALLKVVLLVALVVWGVGVLVSEVGWACLGVEVALGRRRAWWEMVICSLLGWSWLFLGDLEVVLVSLGPFL